MKLGLLGQHFDLGDSLEKKEEWLEAAPRLVNAEEGLHDQTSGGQASKTLTFVS